MTRQGDLLLRLHLASSSEEGRCIVREWVSSLPDQGWSAFAHRAAAPADRTDEIDDAIVWKLTRIAGPTLQRAGDTGDDDVDQLVDARAAIVLGELDTLAAQTGLTRSEAGAWAESTIPQPAMWLLSVAGLSGTTTYVAVARWAIRMSVSPRRAAALAEKRSVGGVDGSALDRLDELRPVDLCDSVIGTLESAQWRQVREAWDGPDELAKPARWERALPAGCKRIRLFSDLHAEGAEMRHCVGRDREYPEGIARGTLEIFAITTPNGDRATAHVENGRVVQCRGRSNEDPTNKAMDLARKCAAVMVRGK